MKWTFGGEVLRRLGEGLGLVDPHSASQADPKKIKQALDTLEDIQVAWRRKGLTAVDVRRMVNEGRP